MKISRKESFMHNETFQCRYPTSCPEVPSEVLDPRNTWSDKQKYDLSAKRLALLFVKNFEKFGEVSERNTKCWTKNIKQKVARSRFELLSPGFFSRIQSLKSLALPWRLATRFGTLE